MSGIESYTWPEPTALQSTTDPDQTVKLHSLCTVCQRLVDEFHRMIYKPHHYLPYEGTDYSTECKHYRSSLQLAASSGRGCHLCSILWARLQAETSTLESLRLLESYMQDAYIGKLDMVPHSYALRVFSTPSLDYAIILYYPPKYHRFSQSEELCSLPGPYLSYQGSRDMAWIEMHTISCVCILLVNQQALEC